MEKRLLILFFCLFVVMAGYGLTLPVLPYYIERLALSEGATSAQAYFQVGLITGIFAFSQFLFAPVWGKWSDQVGRRPLFLMGLVGFAVFMAIFGIGTNLIILYSSRILSGIFSAAVLPMANAYVADLTSEKDRGWGMSWLGGAVGLGIVVGPAIGAYLSQWDLHLNYGFGYFHIDSFSLPFFAASLLALMSLSAAMRWLPESLKPVFGEITRDRSHFIKGPKTIRWFGPFLSLAFLNQFALALFEGTFALHAKQELPFGPTEMGLVFVVCGFVMAAAQATVVVWLISRLSERILLQTGFALMGVGLAMLMTTQNLSFILLYVAIFAFGVALIVPCLATLVSKRAGNRSGVALGQLVSANNLGQAGGPIVGGVLFVWQIHAPYLLTASLLLATAVYVTRSMSFQSARFSSKKK
jgi:DHA1 family multidrug resistance protein-like MFS transporter